VVAGLLLNAVQWPTSVLPMLMLHVDALKLAGTMTTMLMVILDVLWCQQLVWPHVVS
jgi:hypothetical protein